MVTDLRAFVGFTSYYRKHVKNFARVAKPLYELTEKGEKFIWTENREHAFQELKERLSWAPVLAYPDLNERFILDADASQSAVGAVLSQTVNGEEQVIAYFAKALSKPEQKYCVTRKELLGVILAIKHYHTYLAGAQFTVRSDHSSLRRLMHFKDAGGQMARWL